MSRSGVCGTSSPRGLRSEAMTAGLELRDMTKDFGSGGESVRALANINLRVGAGELVCIVGASGCGKSTLLGVVAGLIHPTSGDALVDGQPILGPGPDRGIVFQNYSLFPWRSVAENVAFGLEVSGLDR